MGVAAMTLSGGEYAIHGTNKPESIGKFASYGCIRMLNQDITDLFGRVDVGTQVVVTRLQAEQTAEADLFDVGLGPNRPTAYLNHLGQHARSHRHNAAPL